MDRQIARKHLQSLIFKNNAKTYVKGSEKTMNCCHNLFLPKRLTTFHHQTDDKVTYCGKPTYKNDEEIGPSLVYNKCIYKSMVLHSIGYGRTKKKKMTVLCNYLHEIIIVLLKF